MPIDEETIEILQRNEIDKLSVKVGGMKIKMDTDYLDENTLISILNLKEEVNEKIIKSGYIADVNIFADNEKKEKLEKPVELSFDLSEFGFWEEETNPSLLSIYRLNELTGEWNPVGGVYDPVTNTIKIHRMNLSKYTVMMSKDKYDDLDNSANKDTINMLLGKGVFDNEDSFEPYKKSTREEVATWVTRHFGLISDDNPMPLRDVDSENKHYRDIASALSAGLIQGGENQEFKPDDLVTKEELAVIIARGLTKYDNKKYNDKVTAKLDKYNDVKDISPWAKDQIALLLELRILIEEDVNINPKANLTREEVAVILGRLYN